MGSRECLRIFRGLSSGTCYTLGFVLLTDIWLDANLAFQRIEEDKLEECNQRRLVKFIFAQSATPPCLFHHPIQSSFTIMRRTFKRGTKARLSLSGGPHAPANIASSMEEVNVGGKIKRRKCHVCYAALCCILYAKFSQILEVLLDFHRLFESRNSPSTGILHAIRHVYRSV